MGASAGLDLRQIGGLGRLAGSWLNDATIARTHVRDPRTVLAFAPDAIVLVSTQRGAFVPMDWNAYEAPIHAAAVRAGFQRVALYRFDERYWLWVLVRPGSGVARGLGPKN